MSKLCHKQILKHVAAGMGVSKLPHMCTHALTGVWWQGGGDKGGGGLFGQGNIIEQIKKAQQVVQGEATRVQQELAV